MTKDSSNEGMTPWPTIQVMAFLRGRSLAVQDETHPDRPPKILSPTPIYDFMTCGEFPQPQTYIMHDRIMQASFAHICNSYESLKNLDKQATKDLLITTQHQLVHDIRISMKDVKKEDVECEAPELIARARNAKCLEECRSIAELGNHELNYTFDASCDRIEFNWIKKKLEDFKLTEYINFTPLPQETLEEIRNAPMKGLAVYGTKYDFPNHLRTSLTGEDGIPVKLSDKFRQPKTPRDPNQNRIERFFKDEFSRGWQKN
jgi:hypothetical protein